MKRKLIVFLILIFLLSGCLSCSQEELAEADKEGEVKIYCTDTNETQLFSEYYKPTSKDINGKIRELIRELEKTPENPSYKKVKPDDVVIKEFYIGEDSQLILDFDSNYLNMDTIPEILCRAAFVKTLSQIDEINYVEFYVNSQPLILSDEHPIGQMESSDFIDNTGEGVKFTQNASMTVYFANRDGNMLSGSMLIVENDGSKTMEELVIEQLYNGPLKSQIDLYPVIPKDTVLNKIATKDGICYVDFNEKFLEKRERVTEEAAVYAVVNSLVELPQVSKVLFTINGEAKKGFQTIDLTVLFERRPDLILNEKAGEMN